MKSLLGHRMRMLRAAAAPLICALPAAAQCAPWVGTWAIAPMRGDAPASLEGATLRQIVHTSLGGDELRIQISNLYGEKPLQIASAHVAQRSQGSSIVAGSDRHILFGGSSLVVIAPRSTILSDPIVLKTAPLADLAISFYIPSLSGPVTFHLAAHQTNYIATGDVTGQMDLRDATHTGSAYFLTGVEVRGREQAGAVVTLGASITEGYAATENAPDRWPEVLAQRLIRAGANVSVLNEGISGNRLLAEGAGPDAEDRFERDVLDQPGVGWVIFSDDPINDLGSTRPAPGATQLIEATQRLIAKAHAKHIRFVCSTLTPYKGAGYWRPQDEIAREQYNAFVRDRNRGCDALIDQDAATHDPADPARFLPAYDSGDHLHPNDAGHRAIANAVDLSLFLHPGMSTPPTRKQSRSSKQER